MNLLADPPSSPCAQRICGSWWGVWGGERESCFLLPWALRPALRLWTSRHRPWGALGGGDHGGHPTCATRLGGPLRGRGGQRGALSVGLPLPTATPCCAATRCWAFLFFARTRSLFAARVGMSCEAPGYLGARDVQHRAWGWRSTPPPLALPWEQSVPPVGGVPRDRSALGTQPHGLACRGTNRAGNGDLCRRREVPPPLLPQPRQPALIPCGEGCTRGGRGGGRQVPLIAIAAGRLWAPFPMAAAAVSRCRVRGLCGRPPTPPASGGTARQPTAATCAVPHSCSDGQQLAGLRVLRRGGSTVLYKVTRLFRLPPCRPTD